jgi:hypothetical protein
MIRCTGPQLIEMTWQDVLGHFVEKRNFTAHPQGGNLRVERGAEVFDFLYEQEKSDKPPQCVTVVGLPGIAWQELVARATGVQPRRMKLGKPISTSSRGQLPLLIEGDDQQFTVKIGACRATPGQNPYEGAKP